MTRKTAVFLLSAALATACHRSSDVKRTDQNYQVVQEGQASGVTSTINAPGEAAPPVTDTAVDTTTNFTLPDNPAPLGTQTPNSVAGTLPPGSYNPYPAPPRPHVSRPAPQPQSPMSSGTQATEPPPQPPPTDTVSTQPPPTDTSATTPPPSSDEKPKKDKKEKKEGERTDTTATTTAPPPPPQPPV